MENKDVFANNNWFEKMLLDEKYCLEGLCRFIQKRAVAGHVSTRLLTTYGQSQPIRNPTYSFLIYIYGVRTRG